MVHLRSPVNDPPPPNPRPRRRTLDEVAAYLLLAYTGLIILISTILGATK